MKAIILSLAFAACAWSQCTAQSWTTYTPTTTHLTNVTIERAAYEITDDCTVNLLVAINGTSDGSFPTFSLPQAAISAYQTFAVALEGVGTGAAFMVTNNSTVQITRYDGGQPTYSSGGNNLAHFRVAGSYQSS